MLRKILLFAAIVAAAADDAAPNSSSEEPPAETPAEPAASPAPQTTPTPAKAQKLPFKLALRAARPWSFGATVAPVLYGTALAYAAEDAFSAPLLVLTLVTTLGVHAAGNLINTLYDFERGFDSAGSSIENARSLVAVVQSAVPFATPLAALLTEALPLINKNRVLNPR